MTEKEPASENPGLIIRAEGSDMVEEGSAPPAVKAGILSVVYADGTDNPPHLMLSGVPGVPETLLVVDAAGTPVAQYTAGPVSETRIVGGLLGAPLGRGRGRIRACNVDHLQMTRFTA